MMRKEYNKFFFFFIMKNKFEGFTFCVMAIAICSQYLNSDTVVIIGFLLDSNENTYLLGWYSFLKIRSRF